MNKFAEADQPVFDYLSETEEILAETKHMLEEVVTLVYSYLLLPQHTDPSPSNAFYQTFLSTQSSSYTTQHFSPLRV